MPRRKIPTKAELIQLQKIYKTDDKIAERLGNVTPQLVAYWRRKKNIPKHSFPKFSGEEIRDLWERYGDDYRCGLELGISKAAFYNWRRKYALKQLPPFLRLEQLELDLGGVCRVVGKKYHYGQQTATQKILSDRAGLEKAEVGQTVEIEPDLAILHDDASIIIKRFQESGLNYVWNPNRIAIALDQHVPAESTETAETHKLIREFVKRQNIKHFYDIHEGICHQVVIEKGHILPGQLAVGTDTRIASFGCLGAFAVSIADADMASLWATGRIRLETPATIKIAINGKMAKGVHAKDIILFVIKKLSDKGTENRAIEFHGTTISQMSISERLTITSYAIETGVRAAICPFDSITRRYLLRRARMPYRPALADKDAVYQETYEFNIDQLAPQIARPHDANNIDSVANTVGLPINQVVIGSCADGQFDDLRIAADIIKGKEIHPDVRMLIFPGSRSIYLEALKKGLIRAFIEAGAVVLNPGCGSYAGIHQGALAVGERCLATGGRSFKTEMGSPDIETYLVSPATAAASALKGVITDPMGYVK